MEKWIKTKGRFAMEGETNIMSYENGKHILPSCPFPRAFRLKF